MQKELTTLFIRDLNTLKREIDQYEQESFMWKTIEGISNSGGNLCLHLIGNLNHFIGATLGESGYVRDREAEFKDKDVPVHQLQLQINNTIAMIESVLPHLTSAQLEENYPLQVFQQPMKTSLFLMHLLTHLNYHLGQINYHRRLIKKFC